MISDEQILELVVLAQSLPNLVSEECSAAVLPFICQYAYPTCDGDGSPLLITQEQCVDIRDDVCANEWRLIMITDLASLLPNCEGFEKESNIEVDSKPSNVSEPLKCHHQFTEFCGVCLPSCKSFTQYSDHTTMVESIADIFVGVLAISGEIVFLVGAVVRWKQM